MVGFQRLKNIATSHLEKSFWAVAQAKGHEEVSGQGLGMVAEGPAYASCGVLIQALHNMG